MTEKELLAGEAFSYGGNSYVVARDRVGNVGITQITDDGDSCTIPICTMATYTHMVISGAPAHLRDDFLDEAAMAMHRLVGWRR